MISQPEKAVTRQDVARILAELGDKLERSFLGELTAPSCAGTGTLSVTLDPYGDKVAMIFVPDVVRNVA